MALVVVKPLRYGAIRYKPGDAAPTMPAAEKKRLLELGVIEEVSKPKAEKPKPPASTPPPATDATENGDEEEDGDQDQAEDSEDQGEDKPEVPEGLNPALLGND